MTVAKRQPARGNIVRLTTIDYRDKSGTLHPDVEVAILDDDSMLAIEYDRSRSMPAVRANEVDTLHRDPFLRDALAGCKNMEQRQSVLLPLAKQGYAVSATNSRACTPHGTIDCWMCNAPAPTDPTPEPVAAPVAAPAAFDPTDPNGFITKPEHNRDLTQVLNESAREFERIEATIESVSRDVGSLAVAIDGLRPTVIQIGASEPVTLPAGELVHEATQGVIEDMEDGLLVYLTGAPGVGKSRMAATIAKSFGFTEENTHYFSVSNMDQKNSLLGYNSPLDGTFQPGPLYWAMKGHFVFLDEMDAANGAAWTATNAVTDAPFVTFPNGETIQRPERLFILGAGNTTGKGGDMLFLRNQMDAASRNRWVFHHIDYDRNIERSIVDSILGQRATAWLDHCWLIRDALASERVIFSTRNIVAGAKMLRRGRDITTITERALLPGESADIVRKSHALTFQG